MRGIAWDYEIIRGRYNVTTGELVNAPGTGDDAAYFLAQKFNDTVVDDVFEKLRLQIADFDQSGRITLAGEITAFWAAAVSALSNPSSIEPRIFDLDGDGQFVSGGQIDQGDIGILWRLMSTSVGDANFDYQFDSSDFVVVMIANLFENSEANDATWGTGDWDGDFDFQTGDWAFAFEHGLYDQGYLDLDDDGNPDVLPVWAFSIVFSGDDSSFYLPLWG